MLSWLFNLMKGIQLAKYRVKLIQFTQWPSCQIKMYSEWTCLMLCMFVQSGIDSFMDCRLAIYFEVVQGKFVICKFQLNEKNTTC